MAVEHGAGVAGHGQGFAGKGLSIAFMPGEGGVADRDLVR
jgi:hypothetical protein